MGKRGRRATGLMRPHILQVALTPEENEYVARYCADRGFSAATFGRIKILHNGWRDELEQLRRHQKGATLNDLDGRRKE